MNALQGGTTRWVVERLGRDIIEARRPGGSRLQEVALAREFQVSRGAVREALLVLRRQHLIHLLPRRGAIVIDFVEDEIFEFSEIYTDLQKRFLNSLERLGSAAVAALDAVLETKAQAANDGDRAAMTYASQSFWEVLSDEGSNHYLRDLLRSLAPVRMRLAYRAALSPRFDGLDDVRVHRALRDALVAGDQGRFEQLLDAQARRERQLATGLESEPTGCG